MFENTCLDVKPILSFKYHVRFKLKISLKQQPRAKGVGSTLLTVFQKTKTAMKTGYASTKYWQLLKMRSRFHDAAFEGLQQKYNAPQTVGEQNTEIRKCQLAILKRDINITYSL